MLSRACLPFAAAFWRCSSASCAACESTPSTERRQRRRARKRRRAPRDGGAEPACSGLDECACAQTPGCAPLTTDCYCPPDSCGSTAACACQGGRYLGCNPVGTGCSTSSCGLLAQPAAPDQNGCTACVEPADCPSAIAELAGSCTALPIESTQWLCGTGEDSCAAFCLAGLRTCESAVCALCLDCSCSNDLFDSCLSECLSSAQNRH